MVLTYQNIYWPVNVRQNCQEVIWINWVKAGKPDKPFVTKATSKKL